MTRHRSDPSYAYHEPHGSPCTICGLTRARHRVRHPAGCACGASHKGGRSPAERTRTHASRRYIVGVDGEGIGRDPHRYTLFAWSDSDGRRRGYVEDVSGLSTDRCLSFLLDLPADARVYGYYLAYDWTMILRDLPNRALYRLFRPALRARPKGEGGGFSPIRWRGYRLHWLGGMVRVVRGARSVTVWDVGRFYQTSFVAALAAAGIDPGDIPGMKARRATFGVADTGEIRAYCLAECAALARLVRQLNDAHVEAGLPLRSWYGPGSAASVLLDRMHIRDIRGHTPEAMRRPIAQAFFGGRFEHRTIGELSGPIYGADIVSAYPAECTRLPCLEHGTWEHTMREGDLDGARHACVQYRLVATRSRRSWGPLPIRQRDGSIVFPASGATGWAWRDEYLAARRWSQVRFVGAWILRSDCSCRPFEPIREAFETRLKLGKKSAVGGALKRSINSVYGKLAQSVGSPPYRSQVWAGMITSGCRARILDVLWRHDAAVVAVATDGVLATAPITGLDASGALGSWELAEHASLTLVRPGIYWTDDDVRSRGLPRATVRAEREAISDAIRRGYATCALPPITQFGAATAAVYRVGGLLRRSPRYGEWYERPAMVGLAPEPKRRPDWGLWQLDGVESEPYRGPTPDGATLAVARLLGGANE